MRIKLDYGAYMPERAHATDAGLDLMTPEDFFLAPNASHTVNTGVHVEIPAGCAGFLKSKSGLNIKYSIVSEGVIDEGYTGPIYVKLYNRHPFLTHEFRAGDRITQLVILPVFIPGTLEVVDGLEETERGNKGFGSTGR